MRNLKKILALVLAMVMTLSVMVTANAALTDMDEVGATYEEAVTVLTGMGVFKGRTAADGSTYFAPKGTITREEVATIIYRIASGDVTDAQKSLYVEGADFTDVKANDWAAGYIGYAANGGLVNGYGNGKFGPKDEVTGVQVLAMILRANGYDANDEFTGADWDDRVMSTAQSLGILKNVKAATLVAPASRELVAELLFRTIATVDQVEYTNALGYQPIKIWFAQTATIGEEKFNLVCDEDYQDVWGRPGHKWTYSVGDKASTFIDTPVYENTIKVSECDIAHAIGLTKTADIEAAYIDGDAQILTDAVVTSNRYATINPLATTSYVGAQGRVLEVYNMGAAGYRIVEINTYLARVTKVTPATTDKNGHVTAATINVAVFEAGNMNDTADWAFAGIKATGYSVNDYVLVTVANPDDYSTTAALNKAAVKSVEIAPIVAGGALVGWTSAYADVAATHTVNATSYKDADKFELNYRDNTKNWSVITDTYGNIIGLTAVATNYLVIEKIEWKHNAAGFGGYALADVVLADGTKTASVTVATINTLSANNAGDTVPADATAARVSDNLVNNGVYYNHIWTYSINADGSYNLAQIANHNPNANTDHKVVDLWTNATYDKGAATISNQINTVVATDNTVFLYKNLVNDGYTYTVYVGKNNAPSVTGADICVKYNSYGYATLVVVSDYALATNTFLAYVTDNTIDANQTVLGNGYNVYKLGETTPTMVYDATGLAATVKPANAAAWGWAINAQGHTHGSGLYTIEVNTNNQITAMAPTMCDDCCKYDYTLTAQNMVFDRVKVEAPVSGNSFSVTTYNHTGAANAAAKDFNVTTEGTKVIKVYKNGLTASLVEGALSDITTNSIVIVKYTTVGTNFHNASLVYVMVNGTPDINNPTTVTWTPDGDYEYTIVSGTPAAQNVVGKIYTADNFETLQTAASYFGGIMYVTAPNGLAHSASATELSTSINAMLGAGYTVQMTNVYGTWTFVPAK